MRSQVLLRSALVAATLVAALPPVRAQHFARQTSVPATFEPGAVVAGTDGAITLVGASVSGPWLFTQALAQRVDAAGNLIHQVEHVDGAVYTSWNDALPLAGGDVLACGRASSSPWVGRIAPDGSLVRQQVSSDWIGSYESMVAAPDGTYWVMGWMPGIPDTNLLVGHLDAGLNWLGQREYAFPDVNFYHGAIVAPAGGGAVVVATDLNGVFGSDLFLARLDGQGAVQWAKTLDGGGDEAQDLPPRLAIAADGDLLLTAVREGSGDVRDDLWVLRLDPQGQPVWDFVYDRGVDLAADLVPLADNGLILAGSSLVGGDEDFAVLRLDAAGNVVWAKGVGGPGQERLAAMTAEPGGDLVLAGTTTSFASAAEPGLWLVRMGADGTLTQGTPWLETLTFSRRAVTTSEQGIAGTDRAELDVTKTAFPPQPRVPTQSVQAIDNAGPWTDLGGALAGTLGAPYLAGAGTLVPGDYGALLVAGARPKSQGFLVVGTTRWDAPFAGGVLVPAPALIVRRTIGSLGTDRVDFDWPQGVPSGSALFLQWLVVDPLAPQGLSFSNAVQAVAR